MFKGCTSFNQEVGNWNIISNDGLVDISSLFEGCTSFNQDLSNWDTSRIQSMSSLFSGCTSFNQNLSSWDLSMLNTISSMFKGCTSFNQDVGNWINWINLIYFNIVNTSSMFEGCTSFNQDLSEWNVENIIDMSSMFKGCTSFNQNLSSWNVSQVTNMSSMFEGCTSFNQNLSSLNVSQVTNMSSMFKNATAFNSPIFKVKSNVIIEHMFDGANICHLQLSNYITNALQNVNMSGGNTLTVDDTRNWTTSDEYRLYRMNTDGTVNLDYPISEPVVKDNNTFRFTECALGGTIALVNNVTNTTVYCIIPDQELTIQKSKKTLSLTRNWIDCSLYDLTVSISRSSVSIPITISCNENVIIINLPVLSVGRYTLKIYRSEKAKTITRTAREVPTLMESLIINITADPSVCFKEGTKILTNKGYVPIETLRKGTLIKTLHGYRSLDMMGKSRIEHGANATRIVEQLYKCSKATHPVFEDLILTGNHAILVDEPQSNKDRVDGKYKLHACLDKNAAVYEVPGLHTIYHLALESKNEYANYGIYANGILVESCSKYMLQKTMTEVTTNFSLAKIINAIK
jgi:surface protein